MTQERWTPGPWKVEKDSGDDRYYVTHGDGFEDSGWNLPEYGAEGEANARLIAAAPVMLEALVTAFDYLKVAIDRLDDETGADDTLDVLEAAIALARGTEVSA